MGSQPCEKIFRQVRSMTSTFYTATNCTLLEFMSKIAKTEFQNYIAYKALPEFKFPRTEEKFRNSKQQKHFDLPNEHDIFNVVESAKESAIKDLSPFNISPPAFESSRCTLTLMHHKEAKSPIEDTNLQQNPSFLSELKDTLSTNKDAVLRDFSIEKRINLSCLPNTAPYIKINLQSGKQIVVKKSSLCWIFTKDKMKLSNDRLVRVASRQASL